MPPLLLAAAFVWDPFVWIAAVLALGMVGLAFIVMANPDLIAKGQDAAGRGMAVGCAAIVLLSACGVVGVPLALLALFSNASFHPATRVVACAPVAVVAALAVGSLVTAQVARIRSERKAWAREMAVPMFVLCDVDDVTMSRTYDALHAAYPAMLQHLRHPGALHWQQDETFPRMRLLCLNGDVVEDPPSAHPNDAKVVVDDLCVWTPTDALIVIYTADPAGPASRHADRLRAKGWAVEVIDRGREDESWIADRLVPLVRARLPQPEAPVEA